MRRAVCLLVGLLLLGFVPAGTSEGDPGAGLPAVPPAPFPTDSTGYDTNVVAWVEQYRADSGADAVPEETMRTIRFFSHYSAPMSGGPINPLLDDKTPYGVYYGYMFFACDFIIHGNCSVDDWWGNMSPACDGWDVDLPGGLSYQQMDAKMTMAEWRGGWVKTYTMADLSVHFSSFVDAAVVYGSLCVGTIGNQLVAAFTGWGVFDHTFIVDPLAPPWQTLGITVGPPPPPYDDMDPPICPDNQPCWGPEDLLPQTSSARAARR